MKLCNYLSAQFMANRKLQRAICCPQTKKGCSYIFNFQMRHVSSSSRGQGEGPNNSPIGIADNQNKHKQRSRRNRPMVHLSSAPNQKYKAKSIGNIHPISPHEITPQHVIPDHIQKPNYSNAHYGHGKGRPMSPQSEAEAEAEAETSFRSFEAIPILHGAEAIQKMKKAGQLAAEMVHLASSMVQSNSKSQSKDVGVGAITTDEIDEKVHNAIVQAGGYPSWFNYNGFPKSLCSSVNEVVCHAIPDLRPLKGGDLASFAVSVYLDGYHSSCCKSILIQEADADTDYNDCSISNKIMLDDYDDQMSRAKALMQTTERALYESIGVCFAGAEISEIGKTIHDIAESEGYRPLKNVCGHGIGSQWHMLPEIKHYRNRDKQLLEAGMVITIAPVLVEGHHAHVTWENGWTVSTVDGGLSAQFEHTILINEDGPPDILTSM